MRRRVEQRVEKTLRFVIGGSLLCVAGYLFWLPDISSLKSGFVRETNMMRIRENVRIHKKKKPTRIYHWVSYEEISPHLRHAVIIAEDDVFYQHHGIDPVQIKIAIERNLEKGRYVYGGSTITQQLAKNLYLSPSKNLLRKLKEAIIAWRMEKALSKKRILEIYLNVVEWGPGIYGAEAASQVYFGKHASDLTLEEAISLAVTLPNPRRYHPLKESQVLVRRKENILERMQKAGYIPTEEEEIALSIQISTGDAVSAPVESPSEKN
ncbi:MAG: monofunctional biosynthetic peptidoglycan transglycosylase [Elusimicrobia bacterium]|nr:monofunctional biosynthetic peptidoglycan transglycosylase [Elusimicrobiota bacterium]